MRSDGQGTEVCVPHLAESLVSATLVTWLKQPGDEVREYEALCVLATDKVNVEMPSPMEGTITRILVQEGETAEVGAPICLIQAPDAGDGRAASPAESRYSPAVLHLAQKHGIDLRQVKGTALGGRISRKDVLAFAAAGDAHRSTETPPAPESRESVPASRMRSVIARRMRQSLSEIPHAWMMIEADVTNLTDLRERWKERFAAKEGVPLTVTPFVLKAITNAIKDYPVLNSTWESEAVVLKKDIHLNIAVGSEDSVVTPVIRHADRITVAGLAIELDDLVRRARNGKLKPDDLQGGTFTFNNTGAYGSILSYPIINYPQAAIITFESIVRKPVVVQEHMLAIRSVANLCLSLDHRILDGMICGRFMQRVRHYLEQYQPDTAIY